MALLSAVRFRLVAPEFIDDLVRFFCFTLKNIFPKGLQNQSRLIQYVYSKQGVSTLTKRLLYLVIILGVLIVSGTSCLVVTGILTELLTEDASKNHPKDCQFILDGKVLNKNKIVVTNSLIIMGGVDDSRNFWFHVSKPAAGLEVDVQHDPYCHFTYGRYIVRVYRRSDNKLVFQHNIRIDPQPNQEMKVMQDEK